MTTWGFGGLGVGWGWLDMRSGRQGAGLKPGQDMLNEFGARGGHGRGRRWGGLGLGEWRVGSGGWAATSHGGLGGRLHVVTGVGGGGRVGSLASVRGARG